ncbi:DUF2155 domain-containing protein [Falsihalocynthiibacter sp. SS001]|uniref:DUF2155 domain-containing protein n=1 Tax=Falsihalocynthiibacter sp. SS001 TaxID=3349698 RepID=UPI0036D43526
MLRLSFILALSATPLMAQDIQEQPLPSLEQGLQIEGLLTENNEIGFVDPEGNPLPDTQFFGDIETEEQADKVVEGLGVVLRGLDRVSTDLTDIELAAGEEAMFGPLLISLKECRYPPDNPSGEAYAYLTVEDRLVGKIVFEGWMIESAPALNALDHSRYDVWVLSCKTASADASAPAE